jgi:hypothetical protein
MRGLLRFLFVGSRATLRDCTAEPITVGSTVQSCTLKGVTIMTEQVGVCEALEKARSNDLMDELDDFSLDVDSHTNLYLALRTIDGDDVFFKLTLTQANELIQDIVSQVFEEAREMMEMQEEQQAV